MRKIALSLAGAAFTAVLPTVVGVMGLSISPHIGWTIIALSVAFGLGMFALAYWPRAKTPAEPRRDMRLSDAVKMAKKWGEVDGVRAVVQAARDGSLTIYGVKDRDQMWSLVPRWYWDNYYIKADGDVYSTARPKWAQHWDYRDLMTSKAQARALWPKR